MRLIITFILFVIYSNINAQTCSYNYNLNWQEYRSLSPSGWQPGNLNYSITETDSNPRSVDTNFSLGGTTSALCEQGNGSSFFFSSPLVTNSFYQNTFSLILAVELAEMQNNEYVTFAFRFSEPVLNLKFNLLDIDANVPSEPGADRKEFVEITGYNRQNNNIQSNPTLTGGSANSISGNTATGTDVSSPSSSNGNVAVDFSGSIIDSVVIKFSIKDIQGVVGPEAEPGFGITSFDYCIPETTLPVTLISFSGEADGNTANFNWSTSSEINSDRFDLEVSYNAKDFSLVSSTKAQQNSNEIIQYLASNQMREGLEYYRLKIIDLDGKISFSKTIAVRSAFFEPNLSFGPNPTSEHLFINNINKPISKAQLVKANGEIVLEKEISNSELTIDSHAVPKGLYLLLFLDSSKNLVQSKKVIFQ